MKLLTMYINSIGVVARRFHCSLSTTMRSIRTTSDAVQLQQLFDTSSAAVSSDYNKHSHHLFQYPV